MFCIGRRESEAERPEQFLDELNVHCRGVAYRRIQPLCRPVDWSTKRDAVLA